MVPILVHEFATEPCDPEPQPILTRARLYRVSLPPDQLNANGYYDGNLDEAFLTRFDRKKKSGRADLRASAKRIKLPSPGALPRVPLGKSEVALSLTLSPHLQHVQAFVNPTATIITITSTAKFAI